MDSCLRHGYEQSSALCGRCGAPWCGDCLIYVHGPTKPPYCMGCAMFLGGVRGSAARPAISRRQAKGLEKAAKSAAKTAKSAAKTAARDGAATGETAGAAPDDPEAFEWDRPLWDRQPASVD